MTAVWPLPGFITPEGQFRAEDYSRALLNILDDFAEEKLRLKETHAAVLNILEDAATEKAELQATQRAALNILDDFAVEKNQLRDVQSAILNIFDDLHVEKALLEDAKAELLRTEEAIRRSLREKEVLLQEVHHRVKNNLQVVSSLINKQVRKLRDASSRDALTECKGRVQAIALIHQKLYQSKDYGCVPFSEYARSLAANILEASGPALGNVKLGIYAESLSLPVDKAIPCGLILNELMSNAFKHAFPNERTGRVEIRLERDAERIEMVVEDDGVGMDETFDPATAESLGMQLVVTLVEQLYGELEIRRGPGTTFRVRFPAEAAE